MWPGPHLERRDEESQSYSEGNWEPQQGVQQQPRTKLPFHVNGRTWERGLLGFPASDGLFHSRTSLILPKTKEGGWMSEVVPIL